uniref:Uncharacterized protein n=1 Tax=Rhizophora mucronata TaxID=61149 RepID=A0A2P2M5H8_RHIMU
MQQYWNVPFQNFLIGFITHKCIILLLIHLLL